MRQEGQGVIVAGPDARARAKPGNASKDIKPPRDIREAPSDNPPTGDARKRKPKPKLVAAD